MLREVCCGERYPKHCARRHAGSVKEGAARDVKYDYGEDEELHVLITGDKQEDVSAMCMCRVLFLLPFHCRLQRSTRSLQVDAAASMVERLLQVGKRFVNLVTTNPLRRYIGDGCWVSRGVLVVITVMSVCDRQAFSGLGAKAQVPNHRLCLLPSRSLWTKK